GQPGLWQVWRAHASRYASVSAAMIVAGRLQTSGSDRNSGDSIEGSWVAQRGQSTDHTDRCPGLASRPCSVFPANTREWISLSGPAPSRPGAIDTGDT